MKEGKIAVSEECTPPQKETLNLFLVGEENQRDFPDKVTILYLSGEIGERSTLLEAKFLFFTYLEEAIEFILLREVYPYPEEEFSLQELELSFLHDVEERKLFSSYNFFSLPYLKEVVEALREITSERD